MKKAFRTVALLGAAALLLLALTACGGDKTPPPATDDDNKTPATNDKVYKIASDTAFAPFEYKDLSSGNYVGVDMDILKAIAEDQGFQYKMDNVGFDPACNAVQAGQADAMIAGMSITEKRKADYDFSDPYYTNGQIMFTAKDSTVKTMEDLKGKTVAAKVGTAGHDYATQNASKYGYQVKSYEDSPTMYNTVAQGIDVAGFEDTAVAIFSFKEQSLPLQTVGEEVASGDYGFAVKKGQCPELITMFNEGLKNIKDNGTYEEILAKYGL